MEPTNDKLSLIIRVKQGDKDATAQIVKMYQSSVAGAINPFLDQFEADDLTQEARIALIQCVMTFEADAEKDVGRALDLRVEFIVRRRIIDFARANGRIIRIPPEARQAYYSAMKVSDEWTQQKKIHTISDLAEYVGVEPAYLQGVHDSMKFHTPIPLEDVLEGKNDSYTPKWHEPGEDDVGLDFVESAVDQGHLRKLIMEALPKLPPKERAVIKQFYGFDCKPRTLTAIAKKWKLTQSRVVQIHTKAKKHLAEIIGEEIRSSL